MKMKTMIGCALYFVTASVCVGQITKDAAMERLDGSTIAATEADAFAKKTLADARVMGAQIAVLGKGKLVWSAAYGFRGRDPDLPMDHERTTGGFDYQERVCGLRNAVGGARRIQAR
jgi:CubicO group peptidase (beta-lactamase class C family)